MQWSDLFAAVALLLIFEGILPFLNPGISRSIARKLESISDVRLRSTGLVLMLLGLAILLIVR